MEIILEGALRCVGGMMDSYNSFVLSARWGGGGRGAGGGGGVGFFCSYKQYYVCNTMCAQFSPKRTVSQDRISKTCLFYVNGYLGLN